LAELNETIDEVTRALEEYRLNEAAQTLYKFFWDNFCDWYIELTKSVVSSREDTAEVRAARSRIVYILETSLRLLHPLMPYITEEIWQRLPHRGESIMVAPWPEASASREDRKAREQMQVLIAVITKLINKNAGQIKRLARVEEITISEALPEMKSAARDIVAGIEIGVPLEGLIDFDKERERIKKEIERKENETRGLASRLDNPSFAGRAPREVVDQTRQRHAELRAEIEKLRTTLTGLSGQ
jgi:valyl-tRNA synthetase